MTTNEPDDSQPSDESAFGNDADDATVDALLRRHFQDELDGQVGRSATFLTEQLLRERREQPAASAHAAQLTARQPGRGADRWAVLRPWAWTVAAGSLAAAAAVVAVSVTSRRLEQPKSTHPAKPQVQFASNDDTPDPIERTVFYRTVDDGTVFLDDDTPARQLRRQQVEQITWLDRRTGKTSVTQMVPKEDVMLVAYDKH